ncbi:type II toxin-antitoxin system RatA family toxin [Orenia marismortui]|uniref:Ribosome-associated toxin RatA of RatAB toxin-antitoxin module n=1 Tax=Orenia marismortui TaxID=46469 RepID=A0A4R8H076_9FIRM|nr:aromatase/cyclase [Orenia marismortui]TDX52681.1 ribosome-associated toxin RatA of RatAB toxin-antitoxin module [Orenia marismortui]
MPYIEESIEVNGKVDRVYKLVKDMESYPNFMPDVLRVEVIERDKNTTITNWVTNIDGRKICWTERDYFNDDEYQIIYKQISGDLKKFDGEWNLERSSKGIKITLTVDFEFGIPMLAPLLNPILKKKVRANSKKMLEAVKEKVEEEIGEQCS